MRVAFPIYLLLNESSCKAFVLDDKIWPLFSTKENAGALGAFP